MKVLGQTHPDCRCTRRPAKTDHVTSLVTTNTSRERLASLDGLRALALTRVIVWHVTGWAAATWVIAAVPAMFAVTGALLARSFSDRSTISVLTSRARRLFPALWVYSAFVLVMSKAVGAETSAIWHFIIPLFEPTSELGGQWFTSALWYLQAYVWILLLSPALWWIARRWGGRTVTVGAAATLISTLSGASAGTNGWAVGNVVLYSTCAVAGMTWLRDGLPSRTRLLATMTTAAVLSAAWMTVRPTTGWVVNDDHLLHLLVGTFWCSTLLSLAPWLPRFSTTLWARALNSRSLTVYLWHSSVAWLLWQVTPARVTGIQRTLVVLVLTCALLPLVIATVGLVEKRPTAWTRPHSLAWRSVVATVVVIGLATPHVAARVDLLAPPADQPLPPSAAPTIEEIPISARVRESATPRDPTGVDWLEREIAMFRLLTATDAAMQLGGTRALVIDPEGRTWFGRTGDARHWHEPSFVGSITKTFTTALVMRLVERGLLDLDAPVGDLGLNFRHRDLTLRQLITHTAGTPEMSRSKDLADDGITPAEVIEWLSARELRFQPGAKVEYSTTGFVVVGVVVEQVTGRQYEDLIDEEFATPYGYSLNYFRGRYKSIGYATGGISMTMTDLADWIRRYVRERSVTAKPWPWDIRVTSGLGVHGYCPCDNGEFAALGHLGGRTFATVDGDGFVVIVDTRGILVLDNYRRTMQFAHELRLLAGGGTTSIPGN